MYLSCPWLTYGSGEHAGAGGGLGEPGAGRPPSTGRVPGLRINHAQLRERLCVRRAAAGGKAVLRRCESQALEGTSEIRTAFNTPVSHLLHYRHWMQPSIRSYTKIVHRVTFGSDTPHVQNRISKSPVNDLVAFIANCHRLLVITGAGVSTDSGVPDYRWPRMPCCCPRLTSLQGPQRHIRAKPRPSAYHLPRIYEERRAAKAVLGQRSRWF